MNIQLLAALRRSDTGSHQNLLRTRTRARPGAQRSAQSLTALSEGRVHNREYQVAVNGRERLLAHTETHQARVNLRCRPEHVLANHARLIHLGIPISLHRGHTVDLRTRGRRKTVGDLVLDHHQGVTDTRELRKQVQKHRNRHVIGQVRHQSIRSARQLGDLQCIHKHHVNIARLLGAELLNRVRKLLRQRRVNLNRNHILRSIQDAEGQRTQTRANLQHRLLR